MNKIIHVATGLHTNSSGPSYVVSKLVEAQIANNADVEIWTNHPYSEKITLNAPVKSFKTSKIPHPVLLRSPQMYQAIRDKSHNIAIIHNHGLWLMPNIYANTARVNSNCKLVISPHGMLSSWALKHSSWKKKILGFYGQYKALKNADMFHATAESEYLEIRNAGLTQPVAVIPNGIDIPQESYSIKKKKNLLFLGRIHLVKGVDNLLTIWSEISHNFPSWNLIIAGPVDSSFAKDMQEIGSKLQNVQFVGELSGKQKIDEYIQSSIFVLPTHSENFGITIAEALSCATAVITTKAAPWSGLENHKCGWWVNNDINDLKNAMKNAMSCSENELLQMGKNGREWMLQDYNWTSIGEKMLKSYDWLINGGECPEWIKIK